MTTPELFAISQGQFCHGPHRCFYCGVACGESFPTSDFVKDSFTGRNDVPCPGSLWICPGCVLCLRESCTLTMIDGTTREQTKAAMRGWSWVITEHKAVASGKQHLQQLRMACINGPDTIGPWSVVLSDSGQKHLLYRGHVNASIETPWTVTLEGERVTYYRDDLLDRLNLCKKLIAATGKPALAEPVNARFALSVLDRFPDGDALLTEWEHVREQPLSRLAAWLAPNKEECLLEYPANPELPGIPPKTGGPGRSRQAARQHRERATEADQLPSLYDAG